MLGAIIGDIVGSRFEFNNTNSTDFACSNGVVHLLQQLIVLPSAVPQ